MVKRKLSRTNAAHEGESSARRGGAPRTSVKATMVKRKLSRTNAAHEGESSARRGGARRTLDLNPNTFEFDPEIERTFRAWRKLAKQNKIFKIKEDMTNNEEPRRTLGDYAAAGANTRAPSIKTLELENAVYLNHIVSSDVGLLENQVADLIEQNETLKCENNALKENENVFVNLSDKLKRLEEKWIDQEKIILQFTKSRNVLDIMLGSQQSKLDKRGIGYEHDVPSTSRTKFVVERKGP